MTFRSRKVSQEPSQVAKAAGKAASQAKKKLGAFVQKTLPASAPASAEAKIVDPERASKRVRYLKCTLTILFAILCIGLVANLALEGIFGLRVMSIQTVMNTVGTPPPVDAYGHTNLLLLGVGDKTHDGVDLTDTIMVVSLDPKETKSVVMFSIPRDLWLTNVSHVADGRINTLFRDMKGYLKRNNDGMSDHDIEQLAMINTAQEIGTRLDVEIHGVIKADFTGFVQAVDALGGVDVDVPEDIIDMEYPDNLHEDQFDPFRISKGPQHLDGETALKYARSRHTTSDFGRSARQQQLISSLGTKVREEGILKNPTTIISLLKIAGEHVAMTMSSSELLGLANVALKLDLKNPLTIQLSDNSQQAGGFLYPPPRDAFHGASVLLPEDGKRGWQEIKDLALLAIHRRLLATPHDIVVENAGAASGLGRSLGFELIRFGFNVSDIRNRPKKPDGKKDTIPLSLVQTGEDDHVGTFLAGLLSLPVSPLPPVPTLPATATGATLSASGSTVSSAPAAPATVIVLGEDYDFNGVSKLLHPAQ